jgi:uncharacterized protein (UPF0276 family)
MIGLGYRGEMRDWDLQQVQAEFYEVAPENWIRRDRDRLHQIITQGKKIHLHGVSLNIGGHSEINHTFLREVRALMFDIQAEIYSDHLSSSGDAYQLYDLFPIPFEVQEANRIAARIQQIQDVLGFRIAIENPSYYTNIGEMSECDFINYVVDKADCLFLLDVNNVRVNFKNHGLIEPSHFLQQIDPNRVVYLHVAGHMYDHRFGMFIDTHSEALEHECILLATEYAIQYNKPILLEWDNDIPTLSRVNKELECLRQCMTISVA